MKNSDLHPSIHLESWQDALKIIIEELPRFSDALTITLIMGKRGVSPALNDVLDTALLNEKVLAAQPVFIDPQVYENFNELPRPNVITKIDAPLSRFKAQPLRDYAEIMMSELGEECSPTDISIYLNKLGFSSVAVVFPASGRDDAKELPPVRRARSWDAYIQHVENDWALYSVDPRQHFDGRLNPRQKPHVLIDASGLEPRMNGTSRNAVTFLTQLNHAVANSRLDWQCTVLMSQSTREFFSLELSALNFHNPSSDVSERFDVGVNITPVTTFEQASRMVATCSRWIVIHLDVIALRALNLLSQNVNAQRIVKLYLQNADSVVFISDDAREDALSYFNLDNHVVKSHVIREGAALVPQKNTDTIRPISPYVIVLGNDYHHKQVDPTVTKLCTAGYDVVSVSSATSLHPHHRTISAGTLDDDDLGELIAAATAVVFPSMYEGYGLPTAEIAALGKPLVLWDTHVNREVCKHLGTSRYNYFCASFDEIVEAVDDISAHPQSFSIPVRTIEEFNSDVLEHIAGILRVPAHAQLLSERWEKFATIEAIVSDAVQQTHSDIASRHWRSRLKNKLPKFLR